MKNLWSTKEDDFLLSNYLSLTKKEIATALGRSPGAVTGRISYLRRKEVLLRKNRQPANFTPSDDDIIKSKPDIKSAALAIGKPVSSVYHRRRVIVGVNSQNKPCAACARKKEREYQHAYYQLKKINNPVPMQQWRGKWGK